MLRTQKKCTAPVFLPLALHLSALNSPGSHSALPGDEHSRNWVQTCAQSSAMLPGSTGTVCMFFSELSMAEGALRPPHATLWSPSDFHFAVHCWLRCKTIFSLDLLFLLPEYCHSNPHTYLGIVAETSIVFKCTLGRPSRPPPQDRK